MNPLVLSMITQMTPEAIRGLTSLANTMLEQKNKRLSIKLSFLSQIAEPIKEVAIESIHSKKELKLAKMQHEKDMAITIEALRVNRDIVMEYLRESFRERAMVIDRSFEMIEKSIEINDVNLMNNAFALIGQTIAKNPIKNTQEYIGRIDNSVIPGIEEI